MVERGRLLGPQRRHHGMRTGNRRHFAIERPAGARNAKITAIAMVDAVGDLEHRKRYECRCRSRDLVLQRRRHRAAIGTRAGDADPVANDIGPRGCARKKHTGGEGGEDTHGHSPRPQY